MKTTNPAELVENETQLSRPGCFESPGKAARETSGWRCVLCPDRPKYPVTAFTGPVVRVFYLLHLFGKFLIFDHGTDPTRVVVSPEMVAPGLGIDSGAHANEIIQVLRT